MAITALALAGEKLNLLEDAASITVSSEDALRLKGQLHSGRPSEPFGFNAIAADDTITADLNRVLNWDFEDQLVNWTTVATGAGNVSVAGTTIVFSGTYSLRLIVVTSGAETLYVYQDIVVRAGQRNTLSLQLRGDGTHTARVRLQCLETGNWLQSGGASWGAAANVFTRTAATFNKETVSFTTESFATTLSDLITLRVQIMATPSGGTGDVFADEVELFPSWDLLSIHGHNIRPTVAPQLRSSTDNFSASDDLVSALTVDQSTFYHHESAAPIDRRYARLKLVGTNLAKTRIGELVLGQALQITRTHDHGSELTYLEDEIVSESRSHDVWPYSLSDQPRRTYQANWGPGLVTANWTQLRDELYRRSRGRLRPLVLVPDTSRPEVLHCRIDPSHRARRRFASLWSTGMIFTESPFGKDTA
jgi:hypothetical protein